MVGTNNMSHLSGFLALFLFVVLPLYAADLSDLTFSTTNGKVAITYCDRNAIGELVIPDTIEGNPVTSIGDGSFYLCLGLTHITIPDSITYIGEQAFRLCRSLTSITIPDSVISIGRGAFALCGLTAITIPDAVTSIGDETFANCSSLTSITIPDSVTSIGDQAFRDCSSLTSITIPDSVTSIGDQAFEDCRSLTRITFQGAAPTVGWAAFLNVAEGATANVQEQVIDSFAAAGSVWERLAVAIQRAPTITACGFINSTTFFIEIEPAGAGYRVMNSSTLDFGNAVEVTPTLEPTSGEANRFEFPVSGARNFYRIEPTE